MAKNGDHHIFLSTEKMEAQNKSYTLADSLGLNNHNYSLTIIDPNDPSKILNRLQEISWSNTEEYVLNITGGTKMMSQMSYVHFSKMPNCCVYYSPIDCNYMEQLHPVMERKILEPAYQLDLKTYLAAHGYDFSCESQLTYPFGKADSIFNKTIRSGCPGKVPEIANAKKENYSRLDKPYLTGGWFEEWVYQYLKNSLRLYDGQIAFNLKLKSRFFSRKSESDNEIDVAFIYRNKLYVIECKVFSSNQLSGKKIGEVVYKISSLSQSLGLQATSLVAILTPFGDNPERQAFLNYLTQIMRVRKIFSLEDMKDKNIFSKELKIIINYGS